ncbi:hypothetical protein [Asaia astilbis]|uniref:hypothetical protein n=1 Tax=Asaia astilbis TaxID=610244 RepID=UPI0012EB4827|nr:hypothetical protein [Asaia astilbis]
MTAREALKTRILLLCLLAKRAEPRLHRICSDTDTVIERFAVATAQRIGLL